MASSVDLDRARWLGYRWRGHGLDGGMGRDAGLLDDVLLLGLQNSRQGGSGQALGVRVETVDRLPVHEAIGIDGSLLRMWSVRGAPHTHRAGQLDAVRAALAPDEQDEGGSSFVEAVDVVATALTDVVTGPTRKGEASRAVADTVPGPLVSWCERCGATHVPDGLFRAAGRQAQVVLGPEEHQATVLHPRPAGGQDVVDDPRSAFLRAYLRVNGPTTSTAYRHWLEAGTESVRKVWDGLGEMARVTVDGRRLELPADLIEALQKAPAAEGVMLVPPNDPYLRQVDRTLLVPDRSRRQEVFKAVSGPGALLVHGEVEGTWRYRRSDDKITVSPFGRLPGTVRDAAELSAARVAAAVGAGEPAVIWS